MKRLGTILAAALAAAAAPAWAQAPAAQPSPPPPPPPYSQPPAPQAPPAQAAPPQQAPGASSAPSSSSSSTSGQTGGGAASQQVVVNPPEQASGQPQGGTTVVNPPPQTTPVYVAGDPPREPRNPIGTVALDAAYGGLAGLLVGTGVALVDEWDDWERKLSIGAGLGLIAGAAVGVVHAVVEQRNYDQARRRHQGLSLAAPAPHEVARDGQGSPARDPVGGDVHAFTLGGRF